jgi:hypothetical protein
MLSTRIQSGQMALQSSDDGSVGSRPVKVTITRYSDYATVCFAQAKRVLFEAEVTLDLADYLSRSLAQAEPLPGLPDPGPIPEPLSQRSP